MKKVQEAGGVSATSPVTGGAASNVNTILEEEPGNLDQLHPVIGSGSDVAVLDLEYIRSLCTLERRFWSETHAPGMVRDAILMFKGFCAH